MFPTIDYAQLLGIATGHIASLGRAAVLSAIDGGSEQPVTALMSNSGIQEREGELIGRDDALAIIAASPGVLPNAEQHRLVLDGKAYRIVSVKPLRPAGTVLYFACQVRR
jgi:hypothetical protein